MFYSPKLFLFLSYMIFVLGVLYPTLYIFNFFAYSFSIIFNLHFKKYKIYYNFEHTPSTIKPNKIVTLFFISNNHALSDINSLINYLVFNEKFYKNCNNLLNKKNALIYLILSFDFIFVKLPNHVSTAQNILDNLYKFEKNDEKFYEFIKLFLLSLNLNKNVKILLNNQKITNNKIIIKKSKPYLKLLADSKIVNSGMIITAEFFYFISKFCLIDTAKIMSLQSVYNLIVQKKITKNYNPQNLNFLPKFLNNDAYFFNKFKTFFIQNNIYYNKNLTIKILENENLCVEKNFFSTVTRFVLLNVIDYH